MIRTPASDDRGVSIAITHVLTIGITTILVTGLLVGASGLLEDQKTGAAETELRTIGNRMAEDVSNVGYQAGNAGDSITLRTNHPSQVSGSGYSVSLYGTNAPECGPYETTPDVACLVLQSPQANAEIIVPFRNATPISESSVSGGDFYIHYEDSAISVVGERPSPDMSSPAARPAVEVGP